MSIVATRSSMYLQMIQMYGHILVGNLEGSSFRYIMLLGDFIDAVEWKEVEDFRAFAAVVYPFLGVSLHTVPSEEKLFHF